MKITVKRKCDGEIGTVKSAFGSSDGFSYFLVVFNKNIPTCKAKSSHFEVIGVHDNGVNWGKQCSPT